MACSRRVDQPPIGDRVWVFEHARRRGPSIALLLPAGQAGQLQSTPEADIDRSPWDVSFVPIADIERMGHPAHVRFGS